MSFPKMYEIDPVLSLHFALGRNSRNDATDTTSFLAERLTLDERVALAL